MHNKGRRLLSALLVVLALFAASTSAFANYEPALPDSSEYVCATGSVNVRTGPGTQYSKIGYLKKGTIVLRVDTSGKWSVIKLETGEKAYVSSSYLKKASSVSPSEVNRGFVAKSEMPSAETKVTTKSKSIKELINSAPLSPLTTGNQELDERVASIFGKVADSDSSTYRKLKGFYGWLVDNTRDLGTGYSVVNIGANVYQSVNDSATVFLANRQLQTLEGGKGTCDFYAATLLVAARHLGLEAYKVTGQLVSSSGKSYPHTWVIIVLEGEPYIFDAQAEFNNTGGNPDYSRFGVHGEKWENRYVPNKSLQQITSGFNHFRK